VRILYLADIRFPVERANGLQTFETCRALAGRGHAVTLLVRADTVRPARDPWLFHGAPRETGLTISRLPRLPSPVRRGAYLAAALGRAISISPDVVFTRDLVLADMLLRLPKNLAPPVVYESHGYAPVVAGERPAALGTGHAPSWRKLLRLTARESRVWRTAAGYVTLTRVHQQELEDRFGLRPNAAVVPDGVRLDDPRPLMSAPPSSTPFTVTYAGHLYPWKGVDVVVQAIAELPGMHARIVGGQPGEADHVRLDRLAHDAGVVDRVTFTGWLPPASVAGELARAHVLALPNIRSLTSERYTSPLKLFEYLAAGRPIVASSLAAIREILRDDDNALLVEPGSAAALAAAIRRLMGDPALSWRLAQRAFDEAVYYGWQTRAERLEVVLEAARAQP
jgi:glycosyltransferase involved in cell wall biosynthesis